MSIRDLGGQLARLVSNPTSKGNTEMKIARFVSATRELFYFVSCLTMLCRHCESFEEAERIVANSGFPQKLVVD
jgi:hypothetical protein